MRPGRPKKKADFKKSEPVKISVTPLIKKNLMTIAEEDHRSAGNICEIFVTSILAKYKELKAIANEDSKKTGYHLTVSDVIDWALGHFIADHAADVLHAAPKTFPDNSLRNDIVTMVDASLLTGKKEIKMKDLDEKTKQKYNQKLQEFCSLLKRLREE